MTRKRGQETRKLNERNAKEQWASYTEEERKAINAKRSAAMKKAWALKTRAERSAIAKKRLETQRQNRKRVKREDSKD